MTELRYQVKISESAAARSAVSSRAETFSRSGAERLAPASQHVQRGGAAASARLGRQRSGGI
eukprot:1575438-Heterocapsa_arctica.AAC.1